jgi:lysozyme
MNKDKLIADLKRDEGYVQHAYEDSLGYWTIGYGTLIDKRGGGIPEDVASILLQRHVDDNIAKVNKQLPWLSKHPEHVQRAIHNMAYQLGVAGLLSFKNTLRLVEQKRYNEAADNALLSLWAKQTPNRAKRTTDLLRGIT